MTEEEAKTKKCPMAMAPVHTGQLIERPGFNCTASACMAWRWNVDWVSSIHDPVAKTLTYKLKSHAREAGFCGLAGAPQ